MQPDARTQPVLLRLEYRFTDIIGITVQATIRWTCLCDFWSIFHWNLGIFSRSLVWLPHMTLGQFTVILPQNKCIFRSCLHVMLFKKPAHYCLALCQ